VKLNPNIALSFNGQCEDAFRCYERCLNGTTITFSLTWGDSPMAAVAGLPEGSPAGEGGGVRFWSGDGGADGSGAGGGH